MTIHDQFEKRIEQLLAEAKTELDTTRSGKKDWEATIAGLEDEMHCLESVLKSHRKRTERGSASGWREWLEGKNHKDQLKEIAAHSGGLVNVARASDLLNSLGLVKSKTRRNAYSMVHGLMTELVKDRVFEKSSPATFHLVGAPSGKGTTTGLRAIGRRRLGKRLPARRISHDGQSSRPATRTVPAAVATAEAAAPASAPVSAQ